MDVLTKIQSELKARKSNFNSFGRYNYRSVEDIQASVKPLLLKHGATLMISDEVVEVGGRVYVKATATFVCGDFSTRVSAFAREAETKKGMDEAQITGSASSYARKYALGGLFLVDDQADPDQTNKHGKEGETKHEKAGAEPSAEYRKVRADVLGLIKERNDRKDWERHIADKIAKTETEAEKIAILASVRETLKLEAKS